MVSTYMLVRQEEIITGKVELGTKNSYLSCGGNGFNSSTGGSLIEGFVGGVFLFSRSKDRFLGS